MAIKINPVESSNIAGIGYDAETKTLQVNFKGGSRYQYENVEPEKFAEFQQAESPGKFLSHQVKPFHFSHKLEEEQNDG